MDPLTQGAAGMIASQAVAPNKKLKLATLTGLIAGGAADLDVFIQSDANPLLGLMLHRHFTHSLFFIPVGALCVASGLWVLFRLLRKPQPFGLLFLFSFVAYATHGVMDTVTSYGTVLLWPLNNIRYAWDTMAIIDLAFTLPLLVFIGLALWRGNHNFARVGIIYGLLYLAVLAGHQYGTRQVYLTHVPATAQKTARVMPALFRPFSYRGVYRHDGHIYISTLKARLFGEVDIRHHGRIPLVTPAEVQRAKKAGDTLTMHLHHYNWFADGFMGAYSESPYILADYRYGNFGAPLNPLWGVRLDFDTQLAHPVSLREQHLKPEKTD